jgi:hypothetical protein
MEALFILVAVLAVTFLGAAAEGFGVDSSDPRSTSTNSLGVR